MQLNEKRPGRDEKIRFSSVSSRPNPSCRSLPNFVSSVLFSSVISLEKRERNGLQAVYLIWYRTSWSDWVNLIPRVFSVFKMAAQRRPWEICHFSKWQRALWLANLWSRDLLVNFSKSPFWTPRRPWERGCDWAKIPSIAWGAKHRNVT